MRTSSVSSGRRWVAFTAVGALGFAVQLGALWILKDRLGLHYLIAAVVATELAVLLNFACHVRWTWSDRPADSRADMRRLLRFHLTNGVMSIAASVLVMPVLIELGRVHYLVANVVTVGVCAAANFFAADRVVFLPALILAIGLVAAASTVEATELHSR